jgi:TldD protein
MISREPTLERLATAQRLLLEPFGLNESHLSRALAEITAHRVDDADLYFQYTRNEGWSLEEGIVKTGSFSIDQGVGVRAVSGEKTAFAYSDDISEASLMDAARTVRSISAAGRSARTKAVPPANCRQPFPLQRRGPDLHPGQHGQGQAAGKGGKAGPRQGPARGAGHGGAGQ